MHRKHNYIGSEFGGEKTDDELLSMEYSFTGETDVLPNLDGCTWGLYLKFNED